MNDLLFDIPIYLRSCEGYENERQMDENVANKPINGEYPMGRKEEITWPPWEYNDIIGYYKIIINSSSNWGDPVNGVRVEKYITENRRIVRNPYRKKIIIYLNDPWFHKKLSLCDMQEKDLKNTLLELLDELYKDAIKGKNTKKYYIDVEYYKNFIECLDIEKYQEV